MRAMLAFLDGSKTATFSDVVQVQLDGPWLIVVTPGSTHIYSTALVGEFTYETVDTKEGPALTSEA